MNLGELKEALGDLVARTDYTDTKRTRHINDAIRYIQRKAKLPMMEKVVTPSLDSGSGLAIPEDYVVLRDFLIGPDLLPVRKIDINRANTIDVTAGALSRDRFFYRIMDRWVVLPAEPGEECTIVYYAAWDPLVNDGDFNEITVRAPEAIKYAAAELAAIYFTDTRQQEYAMKTAELIEDLLLEKWDEEIATGAAQSMDPFDDGSAYPGGW